MKTFSIPTIKLPEDTQQLLCLIKEELKSRKLFHALHSAGIDDCYFQPHLDTLIMQRIGLCDGTDETFRIYDEIIDRRSQKIEADNDSIMKQALKVYHELLNVKEELGRKNK